ncbi:MAG: ankyrin repeat domain-containing protein [Sphingosinicella sp.]|nr:ankyrin repeat domain-containing protein [Sphingosinicella sp.]
MVQKFIRVAAAAALAVLAVPALGQPSDGYTFLKAIKEGDGNKVAEMVDSSGPTVVNAKERGTGDGALHIVVRNRNLNWLTFLIGKGSRPDMQNGAGETPLGLAAQIGWVEGAQMLLDRRASIDIANNRGETPLIMAVQRRDLAMTSLLVRKGANPKRADRVAGYSALDYAKRDARSAAIVKILETPVKAAPVQGPKR